MRQVEVLEQSPSALLGRDIHFVPENEALILQFIRTFGNFQFFNVNKFNDKDFLSNEDYEAQDDPMFMCGKQLSVATPKTGGMVDEKSTQIHESLVNLIVMESKELSAKIGFSLRSSSKPNHPPKGIKQELNNRRAHMGKTVHHPEAKTVEFIPSKNTSSSKIEVPLDKDCGFYKRLIVENHLYCGHKSRKPSKQQPAKEPTVVHEKSTSSPSQDSSHSSHLDFERSVQTKLSDRLNRKQINLISWIQEIANDRAASDWLMQIVCESEQEPMENTEIM